jgi:acyl-CoA hydrolase
VAIADGASVPRSAPRHILRERPMLTPLVGWMPLPPPWLPELSNGLTLLGGYGLRDGLRAGTVRYVPARYAAVPRLLQSTLRPRLAMVSGRPSPQGLRFALDVAWSFAAAALADEVIVEIDTRLPALDTPLIPGNIVDTVESEVPLELPSSPAGPAESDLAIGRVVAALIPPGATIQWGAGGIPDAAVHALNRRVRVVSGVVTDALISLIERDLLEGRAVADYVLGSARLLELAAAGHLQLGVRQHGGLDGADDPFVSINTALQVGLDGSVNVERINGIQIAGVGGHADYCGRAASSIGGLSIVPLPSQRRGQSTIVPRPEVVTTPRTEVDIVVTEQGVADLRGLTDGERAQALIAVAHPGARPGLERAARDLRVAS